MTNIQSITTLSVPAGIRARELPQSLLRAVPQPVMDKSIHWSRYWKVESDKRIVTHSTGLRIGFAQKHTVAPDANRYVVDIVGIDKLAGTYWAGQAGHLVEEAISLWNGAA